MTLFRFACAPLFVLVPLLLPAQENQLPIKAWKTKLSARNDVGYLKHNEVARELTALDSIKRCEALHLLQSEANKGNIRFQIRMAMILSYAIPITPGCKDSLPSHERLEKALRKCYEINDEILATAVHIYLSNVYYRTEGGLATVHMLTAKELMEKKGLHLFQNYSMVLYNAADLLYRLSDYSYAAKLNKQALQYHGRDEFNKMDSLNDYWAMNTWNNLGLCYERLMIYDSAMMAFDSAYSLAHDPFWKALVKGNRGDVFFLQGMYDSAGILLQDDYVQSLAVGELSNASITLQRIARITSARGDPQAALAMLKEAEELENRMPTYDNKAALYYSYALLYKDLGNADSSFAYMEKHGAINELLAKHTTENRVGIAQLRLANKENINEIESLQKEKSRIKLIRNFSIALILALAAFGYVYINRMRLHSRLKQQEATEAKRQAEIESAHAKDQLNIFTENLREKTKLIEELQSRSLEKEMHQEQIEQMQELSTYTILTDEDWERFKNLFTKVYPGFFIELRQHVPDITLAEQRMAALIKLHIPNKDAAGMLGISHNSIYKTRQRLRQRLGIEKDEEMDLFFREQISPTAATP